MRDALIARLTDLGYLALDFYPDLASTDDPASGFALTVYSPRFSTGYFPQRNRFTVLVETHSWKDYAHRVRVMRNTINSLAELMAAHGGNWLELAHQADQAAMKLGGAEMALDYTSNWREPAQAGGATVDRDASAKARVIEFRGYAYTRAPSQISGGLVTTYDPKTPQIWRVPLRDRVKVSLSATVPLGGYVVPAAFAADIAPRLEAHGVAFSRLRKRRGKIKAKAFRATRGELFSRAIRGTYARTTVGRMARRDRAIFRKARCSRRLHSPWHGSSVALFEPRAPDSFAAWGLFNACFEQKEHMEPYVAEQIAREMIDTIAATRARILESVRAGCGIRRESGGSLGILLAPPRLLGRALQPVSGAENRGRFRTIQLARCIG